MEHSQLQELSSLDPKHLQSIFKQYDFVYGAVYQIVNKELHLLVASESGDLKWPHITSFTSNYTTNFSLRLPVGWVKLGAPVKAQKLWPKGVNFYYPLQNDFAQKIVFAIKPVNSRVKTGALNVVLEILSSRLHHVMASQETTKFISEAIYNSAIEGKFKEVISPIVEIKDQVLCELKDSIQSLDVYIDETDLDKFSEKRLFEIANNLESVLQRISGTLHGVIYENLKESYSEVNLVGLVQDLCSEFSSEYKDRNVVIKPVIAKEKNLNFLGSSEQIKQAIAEVIRNSCNYSAKSHIEVSLYESSGSIYIDIEDDGPGVKDGLENLIFLKYYKGSSIKNLNNLSVGLGLDFAKSTAIEMKGDLIHLRTKDRRSLFRFILPAVVGRSIKAG